MSTAPEVLFSYVALMSIRDTRAGVGLWGFCGGREALRYTNKIAVGGLGGLGGQYVATKNAVARTLASVSVASTILSADFGVCGSCVSGLGCTPH